MHWQPVVATLVFAAVVLAPAAILWCLGLGLVTEDERRSRKAVAGSGNRATRRLRLSNRLAWVALLVIIAYGIYGLGLAMQWGHRASVLLAMAASTALFPLGLMVYRKARRVVARHWRPGILVALLVGPALVPPLLVWLLMGGANWKVALTLSLFGPVVVLPALMARSRVLSVVSRREPPERAQNKRNN
ncbi:MAG: hypothetical protein HY673_23640 [Chloroflexi bacterium]|nr:hypothetical protein [Chloroflexota bacterium]